MALVRLSIRALEVIPTDIPRRLAIIGWYERVGALAWRRTGWGGVRRVVVVRIVVGRVVVRWEVVHTRRGGAADDVRGVRRVEDLSEVAEGDNAEEGSET